MNDFLLQEAKKNISMQKEFQSQMEIMRESMAQQLTSGLGQTIKDDIDNINKPTYWGRIKMFFLKILNTL